MGQSAAKICERVRIRDEESQAYIGIPWGGAFAPSTTPTEDF